MTTNMKTAPAETNLISGIYCNQNGSEIEVHHNDLGKLVGVFRLGGCCAPQHGAKDFALTGVQTGNTISFCVAFPEKECVTAWVGQVDAEGHLELTWLMSIDCHGDAGKIWRATWTGNDLFREGHRGAIVPVKIEATVVAKSHPCYCCTI